MRKAACTARSGSFEWATGAPKSAIAQSPICLSMVPPWCLTTPSTASKNRPSTSCTSSGSRAELRREKPERSANRMVTCRISPSTGPACGPAGAAGWPSVSTLPQPPQKRAGGALRKPQLGHGRGSGDPQPAQKRRSSVFSAEQLGHSMPDHARARPHGTATADRPSIARRGPPQPAFAVAVAALAAAAAAFDDGLALIRIAYVDAELRDLAAVVLGLSGCWRIDALQVDARRQGRSPSRSRRCR